LLGALGCLSTGAIAVASVGAGIGLSGLLAIFTKFRSSL
jgi:hypothetical protein